MYNRRRQLNETEEEGINFWIRLTWKWHSILATQENAGSLDANNTTRIRSSEKKI